MAATKILIVFYSAFGHTYQLAQAAQKGAVVADAEVRLRRVAELPQVSKAMQGNEAYEKAQQDIQDLPEASLDDLRWADGIIWGTPTRYGNMCAQMKAFVDSTGSLWQKGELEGKPTAVFTSTGTQHGGQESTILSFHIPLLHLGMIILGSPYGSNPSLFQVESVHGGSPYGPGTIAGGKGQLQPTEGDLAMATALGKRVSEVAKKLRA